MVMQNYTRTIHGCWMNFTSAIIPIRRLLITRSSTIWGTTSGGWAALAPKPLPYIDTDGDAQRRPFARGKVASLLEFSMEDGIGLLQQRGCQALKRFEWRVLIYKLPPTDAPPPARLRWFPCSLSSISVATIAPNSIHYSFT